MNTNEKSININDINLYTDVFYIDEYLNDHLDIINDKDCIKLLISRSIKNLHNSIDNYNNKDNLNNLPNKIQKNNNYHYRNICRPENPLKKVIDNIKA